MAKINLVFKTSEGKILSEGTINGTFDNVTDSKLYENVCEIVKKKKLLSDNFEVIVEARDGSKDQNGNDFVLIMGVSSAMLLEDSATTQTPRQPGEE